ncbi:LamG-like jellyroll fold domain-containing protein [Siphonobacter aquaeclarae]|nr:LamG-like jellyroll fold domain-containing protein [Siphonobacter aquaeclarae]
MKHLLPPRLSASFLYLSLLFLLSDCRKDLPKREFPKCETAISSVSHQATQLSVEFTVSSANNATFDKIEWDFGDGKKDSGPSLKVTHKYEASATYEVKLVLTDKCGNVTSDKHTVVVSDAVVPTLEACEATYTNTTATIKFKVGSDGKSAIKNWGIIYFESDPSSAGNAIGPKPGESMPVTGEQRQVTLSNLKEGTRYYYRVFLTNVAGTDTCSNEFTTTADAEVTTLDVSNVGNTSATFNLSLKKTSQPGISEVGFYVSTSSNPNASNTINVPSTTSVASAGQSWGSKVETQLTFGGKYYYRAYAKYGSKEVVGGVKWFIVADITSNLVAHIPFDDSTPADLTTRNTPTLPKSASYGSGPNAGFGNAIIFNGTSQYLEMPDNSAFRGRRLTISVWIKTTDIVDRWMQIYSKSVFSDGSSQQLSANLKQAEAGQAGNAVINADYKQGSGVNCSPGVGWQNVASPFTHLPGKWYHVVTVFDGLTAYLYVDGVLKGTKGMIGNELDPCNDGGLRFGAENLAPGNLGGPRYFKGSMDEIRIYYSALSKEQVWALYNQYPNP